MPVRNLVFSAICGTAWAAPSCGPVIYSGPTSTGQMAASTQSDNRLLTRAARIGAATVRKRLLLNTWLYLRNDVLSHASSRSEVALDSRDSLGVAGITQLTFNGAFSLDGTGEPSARVLLAAGLGAVLLSKLIRR